MPDPHDVELAETLLCLTPLERLRALRRYARLNQVIASKEALGRPKDTAALPALYATREALRRRSQ